MGAFSCLVNLVEESIRLMIWNLAGTGLPIGTTSIPDAYILWNVPRFLVFSPVSFLLIIKSLSRTMWLLLELRATAYKYKVQNTTKENMNNQ